MTPQEAYNKLNTAIELIDEVIDKSTVMSYTRNIIWKAAEQLERARDEIAELIPRQDCSVTLDSVKGGSESGEIG